MTNEASLSIFEKEVTCTYRGEQYCVRDNGAVLRRGPSPKRRRPLDEIWTFGSPSASDGYFRISHHKVHRIVATAFHGEQPSNGHVVDHIDTNRRNNRPNNLRWVTRLENILLNPITAKRVVFLYGSIEEFFADPGNPKNGALITDFEWMRAVSRTEAEYSSKRMLAWAQSDRPSRGGTLGDWVFGRRDAPVERPLPEIVISKTPGAVQRNWKVPAEFPLCPKTTDEMPLETYFDRLKEGAIAVVSPFGDTKVVEAAKSASGTAIFIVGWHGEDAIKQWSLMQVTFEDNKFVHESRGTFFEREGVEKEFVLAQGLPWEGGETFDDLVG
jgi:hypothetical protein